MREKFAGWNVLFWEYLKRDWKMAAVWILGLGGFAGGFVPAFVEIGKGQGLSGMYEIMKNPAMISMIGITPVKAAADYTTGAMYSHVMLVFSALFAMIISAVHVTNHTRKEEEGGITELVGSFRVGRCAGSFAILMEEVLIHGLLAVLIGGLMASFGAASVEAAPSFLYGASVGLAGIMGAVIALVMAQIMGTSTGAKGVSLGIIGTLYLLRAGTDLYDSSLSMLNPMGWTYLTFPFTENRGYPLAFGLMLCVAAVVFSFILEGGRDRGVGWLPERERKGKVRKTLLSVRGLIVRLNRSVVLSWILVFIILGGAYGSVYGEMETFLESNELIRMMFTVGGASMEASFTSVIIVVMIGLTSILPVVIINKLFTEETSSHMSQLFATRTSRRKLYWVTVITAITAGLLAILGSAGCLGAVGISMMENSSMGIGDFLAAGMNQFPAVLFITALAALALGWMPQFGKFIYVYVGYSIMVNYFKGILNLPGWFEKTAIFSWIPRMPADSFDGVVFGVVSGISVILLVMGALGYQRRDLIEND